MIRQYQKVGVGFEQEIESFTDFDDLKSYLLGEPEDTKAELWGATTWIGTYYNKGGVVQPLSSIHRLWASNAGAEFTVGTTTDRTNNIERFGGAAAPTWGAPGEGTGGIILPSSGALVLPFMGLHDPAVVNIVAKIAVDALVPANDMTIGAAMMSFARARAFGGCVNYTLASLRWDRKNLQMTSPPTLAAPAGGGTTTDLEGFILGSEILVGTMWMATHRAGHYGGYVSGAYRADEPLQSLNQQANASSSGLRTGDTDHEVCLHFKASGGSATVRVTELHFLTAESP